MAFKPNFVALWNFVNRIGQNLSKLMNAIEIFPSTWLELLVACRAPSSFEPSCLREKFLQFEHVVLRKDAAAAGIDQFGLAAATAALYLGFKPFNGGERLNLALADPPLLLANGQSYANHMRLIQESRNTSISLGKGYFKKFETGFAYTDEMHKCDLQGVFPDIIFTPLD